MRHVGGYELGDRCGPHYMTFRVTLYAMDPQGRYAMSIEVQQENRVVGSSIIDLADVATKAVIRPELTGASEVPGKVEPKHDDSAIGVFLPGVTGNDTVVVDMPDGQFRVFDAKTKSFQTINKAKRPDGVTCTCNVAALAAHGCRCGRVVYDATPTDETPSPTPADVERVLYSAGFRPGVAGAAIGAAIGTAAGAAVPPRRRGGNILRTQNTYGDIPPAPARPARSSSDADIEAELRGDGVSEAELERLRNSPPIDPNNLPF